MVTPNYQKSDQLRSVNFKSGVTITPPKDYCLDEKLVAETESAGFVLILPCLDAKGDVQAGLVTVTVLSNDPKAGFHENRNFAAVGQQNFRRYEHFGSVKHGSDEQIIGMQQDGWQLIVNDNRYTSVLTLYIPQYETIGEEAAQKRLRSLLQSIHHKQVDMVPSEAGYDTVIRPRARPLT